MRNSRQLRRVKKLDAAIMTGNAERERILRMADKMDELEAGDRIRIMIVQAGLPPVESLHQLTEKQLRHYQMFHNLDAPRDFMELPCWSWELPEGGMMECYRLLGKRNRGEITPAEHRRLVREACGLPPEEASSSGDVAGGGSVETQTSERIRID
jgi:hypothetical protein